MSDDNVLQAFYGALSMITGSGVKVTQENSLRSIAVLSCLIVRSETFASLPFDVLRKEGRNRISDESNPAYRLLSIAPNELMNAGEFWRWKQLTEDITGNAYARIIWRAPYFSEPTEIWPLLQKPEFHYDRRTRQALYNYPGDDFTLGDSYPARDILHFKGPILRNPHEGSSLVDLASEEIGVEIATQQFFSRLLSNGNHFPGYLETDTVLQPDDLKALTDQLKGFSGVLSAGQVRVFDRGLKYHQNDMSLKDAQLNEEMRWQLQRICSVFRMPLAFVQDLTNGTYTNSEQQDLWLGKHTIMPICVNSERVVRHRLFAKQPNSYGKFNLDALLRGDFKTRAEGEAALVTAGILTRNEARADEDRNPIEGLDTPLAALNLGGVSSDGTITGPDQGTPADPAPGPPAPPTATAQALLEPLLLDAADCIRRRSEKPGRPRSETEEFALTKLQPIAAALERAGVAFNSAAFVAAVLDSPDDRTRVTDFLEWGAR